MQDYAATRRKTRVAKDLSVGYTPSELLDEFPISAFMQPMLKGKK